MKIQDGAVATIEYTLSGDDGDLLDTSREGGGGPVAYIQGKGTIVPGLEAALVGKEAGDTIKVTLQPEEAYGPRDESRLVTLPKEKFPDDEEIEAGMQFHAEGETGHQTLTVVSVEGDDITVDANHPLAGRTLLFDVEVLEVREATDEEQAHGHVHGPNGHHH